MESNISSPKTKITSQHRLKTNASSREIKDHWIQRHIISPRALRSQDPATTGQTAQDDHTTTPTIPNSIGPAHTSPTDHPRSQPGLDALRCLGCHYSRTRCPLHPTAPCRPASRHARHGHLLRDQHPHVRLHGRIHLPAHYAPVSELWGQRVA